MCCLTSWAKSLNTSFCIIELRGEKMTQENKNESQIEYNFLVYEYHTWGSFGQHIKVLKFLVDIENKSQKPLVGGCKCEMGD